ELADKSHRSALFSVGADLSASFSGAPTLENIRVIRLDPVQAQVVEEVGEAHPGRQRIEIAELGRQVLGRRHQPLFHQLAQGTHVFQGGLATEQQRNLLQLALAHRQLNVVVDEDEALQIGQ